MGFILICFLFTDILHNGADEFEDGNEIYEAIGEILHEVSANKSEDDIK